MKGYKLFLSLQNVVEAGHMRWLCKSNLDKICKIKKEKKKKGRRRRLMWNWSYIDYNESKL